MVRLPVSWALLQFVGFTSALVAPASTRRQPASLVAAVLPFAIAVFFAYYTFWTLLTPLLPSESPLQDYFPSRTWAVSVPVGLLCLGLSVILGFMGWQALLEARRLEDMASQGEGERPKKER